MIDFEFKTDSEPKAGSILISEPFLSDNYFSRSVIYLCEHNDDGSFGFVLNKYIDTDLKTLLPEFDIPDILISIGGPVDNKNLFYIHTFGEEVEGAIPINNDVFVGGDFESIKNKVQVDTKELEKIRFFIGYSGWSPGQLADEIKEHSWIVINDVPVEYIFNTSNKSLWKSIMEKLGGKFKVMSTFPVNPSDN